MRISDWSSDVCSSDLPTLPLIYTMREGTPEQAALVRQAIQKGGIEDLESIREAVEASGSLDYTAKLARDYVARAIKCRSEEHTSELQSLMRISYAVFCLKKKTNTKTKKCMP